MPAERVRRKGLPVYNTLSECHRMMDACTCDRDRVLILLLFATGARISEALSARVGDLTKNGIRLPNLKQSMWVKQEDGTKKHVPVQAEKHVFLPPSVLAQLLAYTSGMPPTAHIIGRLSDGGGITRKRAWQIIKKSALEAGVFKRHFGTDTLTPSWPHSLRHSAAAQLILNGAPISLVQAQLGHSSLSSTQVYSQLAAPEIEKLIAGIPF